MIAPSPTVPEAALSSPPGELSHIAPADIDRSCRVPVLVLLAAAAFWLGIGALLGVISAIKAHAPGFLATWSWLTYGRVYPVSNNAFVYGFVIQGGLGVGLWMLCRLGRNLLQGQSIITGATLFWNAGLAIGLGLILAGGSSGYPWLEIPGSASLILFCSYSLIAVWALINLHSRRERGLYVSQWFLLTSLLWFPWIFSTAQLLLVFFPVRGVMQAIVNGWYVHNLFELCLAPLGLATIFYFVPKLLGRPLHSRGLALFGFWLLVLFGGWNGAHPGEPVPNWISGVSAVAQVFLLVPLLAFALSWYGTIASHQKTFRSDWVLRFLGVAMAAYLAAAVFQTLGALPEVSQVTGFTLYDAGIIQIKLHGFLGMSLAGAIYYVVPRVAGYPWPSSGLPRLHFLSVAAGVVLSAIALVIGGLVQGSGINDPSTDFLRVVRRTVPFLGINTLGMTLLLVGYAAFVFNLGRLLTAYCPCAAIWARMRPTNAQSGVTGRVRV